VQGVETVDRRFDSQHLLSTPLPLLCDEKGGKQATVQYNVFSTFGGKGKYPCVQSMVFCWRMEGGRSSKLISPVDSFCLAGMGLYRAHEI